MLVIPWLKGCFKPKPKEIVTFVDIAPPAPAANVTEAAPEPAPAPEPVFTPPEPEPTPKPVPKPPTPEPKPEPKPVFKPPERKPEPKPEPKKPEWKPAEVVRQNRRVTNPNAKPQPQRPRIDTSRIKNVLQSAAGSVSESDAYYSLIYRKYHAVWGQPSGTPIGTSATASIRVDANGTVTYKSLTHPSGNSTFDQSVQAALNSISRLPAPPGNLANRTITVDFVLSQ